MGHKGHWFAGEHEAIIDPASVRCRAGSAEEQFRHASAQQRSDNQHSLQGLLFDDRGNRMSPSFTSKRGVRYRFYVSSALLTARGDQGASLRRVSASELEDSIGAALRERFAHADDHLDPGLIAAYVKRVVVSQSKILIALKAAEGDELLVELTRAFKPTSLRARIESDNCLPTGGPDLSLVQAIARAHAWRKALAEGTYQSIESLADAVQWNAKVIRKALRLAFLAPDIVSAVLDDAQPPALRLVMLLKMSTFCWDEQRRLISGH